MAQGRWQKVRHIARRYGIGCAVMFLGHALINRFMLYQCLVMVQLDREKLRKASDSKTREITFRLTGIDEWPTIADGLDLPKDEINTNSINSAIQPGDMFLLTYVDGELAGFTFGHGNGHPHIVHGTDIRIPTDLIYNFGSYTLPAYRGLHLQGLRHWALLHDPDNRDKAGLLGYVMSTNWGSLKGTAKSGYRRIGTIRIFQIGKKGWIRFSPGLRKLGIYKA